TASDSLLTVVAAFGANIVIAVAKTGAAMVTGSASLLAEAAHSWADAGNSVLLLVADHRSRRPADAAHPQGYGREAYVWALLAAVGVFVAGAAVSITHGVHELFDPAPAEGFGLGYAILALAFLLEGAAFRQSVRQARREAAALDRDVVDHVVRTSDPTLRAVFAEDAAALVGLVIAAAGLALHQVTGSSAPDAVASILVGVLLAVVAVALVEQNRRFLVGQEADPAVRAAVVDALLADPDVDRVTHLRLEYVGPRRLSVVADVDLTGDDPESQLAVRLRALEERLAASPTVADAELGVSAPDAPALSR
ncbi:MAG TPA: cation diffusion facilitator family transporter, partial [Iamia sp.]|nr:cation diffusion facilitator family transporter [Iamia sp.]